MRNWFLSVTGGLVLSALAAFGALAQQADIEAVISDQIEAFKADDFDTAFTFATPRLQELFQSPENFRRMVTTGYPMVWRPAEVDYLDLREEGGQMFQIVQITDAKGFTHLLLYQMEQTDAGWRIAAVSVMKQPGATA
jgi:ketosteroid isomerase-like protein